VLGTDADASLLAKNVSKEASAQGFCHGSMYIWEVIARGL